MKYAFPKGSISVIIPVFIQDSSSTTGAGLGGLTEASSIVGGYVRPGGTGVALAVNENVVTEGTYAAPTTVGQVRIGTPANMRTGTYELHLHNDLLATGANAVFITLGGATNMADLSIEIQLTDFDLNSATPDVNVATMAANAIADGTIHADELVNVAKAIWDRLLTGATHNIANSAGKRLRQVAGAAVLHDGTAQAGSINTITLDTGASTVDEFYRHQRVAIVGGLGVEQTAIIVSYVGSTRVAIIAPSWAITPDNTSEFEIEPGMVHAETGWATIAVGLAQAGASSTITLASVASSGTDFYKDDVVLLDQGTGEGQSRVITAYNGTTKVATISEPWDITPDTTSEYIIETAHAVVEVNNDKTDYELLAATQASIDTIEAEIGTAGAGLTDITGRLPAALFKSTATGGTTTTLIDTVGLTQADNDWWRGMLVRFTSGNLDGQTRFVLQFTASSDTIAFFPATTQAVVGQDYELIPMSGGMSLLIADQVWDEAKAVHNSAGSFGNVLNAQLTLAQLRTAVGVNSSDVLDELTQGVPSTNPSLGEAAMANYMALTNKYVVDSSGLLKEVYNAAGTLIWKKALTDSEGKFTEAKAISGA